VLTKVTVVKIVNKKYIGVVNSVVMWLQPHHHRSCLLVTLSPAGGIVGTLYHKLYTQSCAPEDGQNYRPKHVELIEFTNKLLLLHLVGCLYCCIRDAGSHKHQIRGF